MLVLNAVNLKSLNYYLSTFYTQAHLLLPSLFNKTCTYLKHFIFFLFSLVCLLLFGIIYLVVLFIHCFRFHLFALFKIFVSLFLCLFHFFVCACFHYSCFNFTTIYNIHLLKCCLPNWFTNALLIRQ